MVPHNSIGLRQWREEQLAYFKEYLATFEKETREYDLIRQGIHRLEKAL